MHIKMFTPLLTAGLLPARHLRVPGVSVQSGASWAFLTIALCSVLCIVALAWWIPFRMMRVQRTRVRSAERAAAESARNAEIASMTRGLAHEIKNPLTSIRSAIETLRRIEEPEKQRRLLAIIAEDVARLDRLISDISDASRIDAELSARPPKPWM